MTKEEQILKIIERSGIIRPCDLEKKGLSRQILYRLYISGQIVRLGRGLYAVKNYEPTEYHSIVEVCSRVTKGVVCLLSALQFHNLTTQLPHEVWIAIELKARTPRINAPVRFMYFSGIAFTEGIEKYNIEGTEVKVYYPAKTVADCFKYRNKIGLDVAIEALRDCISQKKCTVNEIWKYAKICRVTNIMKPYLEAIV